MSNISNLVDSTNKETSTQKTLITQMSDVKQFISSFTFNLKAPEPISLEDFLNGKLNTYVTQCLKDKDGVYWYFNPKCQVVINSIGEVYYKGEKVRVFLHDGSIKLKLDNVLSLLHYKKIFCSLVWKEPSKVSIALRDVSKGLVKDNMGFYKKGCGIIKIKWIVEGSKDYNIETITMQEFSERGYVTAYDYFDKVINLEKAVPRKQLPKPLSQTLTQPLLSTYDLEVSDKLLGKVFYKEIKGSTTYITEDFTTFTDKQEAIDYNQDVKGAKSAAQVVLDHKAGFGLAEEVFLEVISKSKHFKKKHYENFCDVMQTTSIVTKIENDEWLFDEESLEGLNKHFTYKLVNLKTQDYNLVMKLNEKLNTMYKLQQGYNACIKEVNGLVLV